jgi:hypothetical protein
MTKVKVKVYQLLSGVETNGLVFDVSGPKLSKFSKAVGTSVEETLEWLKLRRNCGRSTGFNSREVLHFRIERSGVVLADTSQFRYNVWASMDMRPPNNTDAAREKFRARLKEVFEYAFRDIKVCDIDDKDYAKGVPARANG